MAILMVTLEYQGIYHGTYCNHNWANSLTEGINADIAPVFQTVIITAFCSVQWLLRKLVLTGYIVVWVSMKTCRINVFYQVI